MNCLRREIRDRLLYSTQSAVFTANLLKNISFRTCRRVSPTVTWNLLEKLWNKDRSYSNERYLAFTDEAVLCQCRFVNTEVLYLWYWEISKPEYKRVREKRKERGENEKGRERKSPKTRPLTSIFCGRVNTTKNWHDMGITAEETYSNFASINWTGRYCDDQLNYTPCYWIMSNHQYMNLIITMWVLIWLNNWSVICKYLKFIIDTVGGLQDRCYWQHVMYTSWEYTGSCHMNWY